MVLIRAKGENKFNTFDFWLISLMEMEISKHAQQSSDSGTEQIWIWTPTLSISLWITMGKWQLLCAHFFTNLL